MDNVVFEILMISMTNVSLNLTNYVLSGNCFVIEYCRIQKVRGCLLAKLVDFKCTYYWGVLTFRNLFVTKYVLTFGDHLLLAIYCKIIFFFMQID